MMGERVVMQEALFYEFSLERHVPVGHLVRAIDRFVDLSDIRAHLRPFYSETGRPSIDPELMIRMLLVGYCFGIRSERRLCEEVHLNLGYRWFCRLGLEGNVPDHSTFSKNRHGRFRDSDLLRELFETTVRRCVEEGLVGGEGFAVDASLIKADANKQRSAAGSEEVEWSALAESRRSVREYLDTLDEAAWGAASEVKPKFVSKSDPAAQWTGALKGHAFFAYATNYLIDLDHAVIVDVEACRAIRQAEVGAARTMIERTQDRFRTVAPPGDRRASVKDQGRSLDGAGDGAEAGEMARRRDAAQANGDRDVADDEQRQCAGTDGQRLRSRPAAGQARHHDGHGEDRSDEKRRGLRQRARPRPDGAVEIGRPERPGDEIDREQDGEMPAGGEPDPARPHLCLAGTSSIRP